MTDLSTMNTINQEGTTQQGVTNWKATDDWSKRISFIQIEPKCQIEGFTGTNFRGRMTTWRGSHTLLNAHEMRAHDDNKMSSYKCSCNTQVSCDRYYAFGKTISGCPQPQCDVVTYSISDSWKYVSLKNLGNLFILHFLLRQVGDDRNMVMHSVSQFPRNIRTLRMVGAYFSDSTVEIAVPSSSGMLIFLIFIEQPILLKSFFTKNST